MPPIFFATPDDFRDWLDANGAESAEVWVGFFKKGARQTGITWPEAVDQALCFGWIDGVRKGLDDERYMIRFTPRRPRSIWSVVNVRRAEALIAAGAMRPAGVAGSNSAPKDEPASTPTSKATRSRSTTNSRRSSAPTRPPGRFSRRNPRRIGAQPPGGSSAPSKTPPAASAWRR